MSSTPYSLRRRLIWLVATAILAIGFLSTLVVYQRAHHEADELLNTQLAQLAETLLSIAAGGEIDHFVGEMREQTKRHAVPIAFEIWLDDDGVAQRIITSPGHVGFDAPIPAGYSDRLHQSKHWRLFAIADRKAAYTVVVGQRHSARDQLAREAGLSLLIPALLALPLMTLAVWWVVGRSLRPVEALAHEIGTLDANSLAPLGTASPLPDEIAPLRSAFNTLIERVAAAFENERRFTADAAHELRTPLAALRVQAQMARRETVDSARQHALDQVLAGVDRMTHLMEQLLTLARVDPEQPAQPAGFDPAPALKELCTDHMAEARLNGQTLVIETASDCRIAMQPAWFMIAARNLLDNALRYAGAGARIEVRLTRSTEGCRLSVADTGPGVPDDQRERLTARFARGETDSEGCGLGLSIVERIAQLSHAQLTFGAGLAHSDGGHGFAVTLHFEAAQALLSKPNAHTR